jgi:uncharacterized protein (UPF0276 family)
MTTASSTKEINIPKIGVGLRHPHYADALNSEAQIDFVEVHSENFFASGGAILAVLDEIIEKYPVSLHSTALGLGSAEDIPSEHLRKLKSLADNVRPILMSDHASFSWGQLKNQRVHVGDLLPLSFNEESLTVLAHNVDRAQQFLGSQLLIENLSAYIQFNNDSMSETEFLVRLTEITGCKLLVDLNNIIVTANNIREPDIQHYAKAWLNQIPADIVGEFHLAGYTQVQVGELVVDDHSQAVSEDCWQLYRYALERFGPIPTLIEWDNNLPSWQKLLKEAKSAKMVAQQVFSKDQLAHA